MQELITALIFWLTPLVLIITLCLLIVKAKEKKIRFGKEFYGWLIFLLGIFVTIISLAQGFTRTQNGAAELTSTILFGAAILSCIVELSRQTNKRWIVAIISILLIAILFVFWFTSEMSIGGVWL